MAPKTTKIVFKLYIACELLNFRPPKTLRALPVDAAVHFIATITLALAITALIEGVIIAICKFSLCILCSSIFQYFKEVSMS